MSSTYEKAREDEAVIAIGELAAAVNSRGVSQNHIATAIGREHGYLVNQIVYGIALGVIRKCWSALRSDESQPVASCGDVMYVLAKDGGDTKEQRDDHPYHDGELTCNAVRGALVTLLGADRDAWRLSTCWIWRVGS